MTLHALNSLPASTGQALLQNPFIMRAILDSAAIPINYCSTDLTFLFVNKTYAEWYGSTPEKIIGMKLGDLLGEEGLKSIRPYVDRVLKGERLSYELGVNLSIGFRYMQCEYTPVFNQAGEVVGWVGAIADMTQRYLLEKALHENEQVLKQEKEKAEAAYIAKSEFLANMSHEIRTPMNAVVGLAHILSTSSPLTEKQQEMIHTLQLSAQSLLALINDLLDVSKIQSNRMDLDNIPFNFSTLISEICAMFAVQAREKNIVLEHVPSAEEEKFYLGDPLRIRQILTNLISNAIKFTHKGGVTIRFSTTPHAPPYHVQAHISVKDTGVGIAPQKHAAIFDKFTQADMSVTRQYGGSGLGLAISKHLAELMGGTITVKSAVGEGAEFCLHLPLEYAEVYEPYAIAADEDAPAPATPQPKNKMRVLLVEDHQPNILVATLLLEGMGYQYDIARNGREALEKVQQTSQPYDAILMDVQMPEMDGYTATRLLREREQQTGNKRCPIIGMTAHVFAGDIEKCLEVGMDDYITKPFKPEELEHKLAAFNPA